jgi:hypothetical protein
MDDDALRDMMIRNWHKTVRQFYWDIERMTAAEIAAAFAANRGKQLNTWAPKKHVLRKMALDVMIESFPENHPPSQELVLMMRHALGLPDSHQVGGWGAVAGHHDDRGNVDHEARNEAEMIDHDHLLEADAYMPLRELERRVKKKLGRCPDRKTLRTWRTAPGYWPTWK